MSDDLTCRQFIEFLDGYIEGELAPAVRAEFERHFTACSPCKCYLKTYRDTIKLARSCGCKRDEAGPPPDAPDELVRAILAARRVGRGGQ